MSLLFLVILS
ncbi:hypothetical protein LINPERPRIM_LOCUS1903 [Linum perenne]